MFELFIALKYLIPKKRSLSTALISLISVIVISLVVWLVIVFLSVTTGIEKNWLDKLTSLNAPIRITPTKEYFSSYYYLVDAVASKSGYTHKTIGEKRLSVSNPYDPSVDMECPTSWPQPDYQNNNFIDPVKTAFSILQAQKAKFADLKFQDYEVSSALMRISLLHNSSSHFNEKPSFLTQMSYLLSLNDQNPKLSKLMLPAPKDLNLQNALHKNQADHEPVYLPKNFQENGIKVGDVGYFSYAYISATSTQEQKIPIVIAGFYDPGVMPIGNKCILVPFNITRTISASMATFSFDGTPTNGIYVWTKDIANASLVKESLQKAFMEAGIAKYWKISTYKEYEFAKDLLQQFQSDKLLFSLIAIIILLVACSNVISMLVLLVNDKKREIAVLQAMGASSKSIAFIFGFCGFFLGTLSSLIGIGAAIFTLRHLDILVKFLSLIQGHEAFNANFFGSSLPNQLSFEALLFVIIVTPLISLIAALVPAMKAAKLHPSNILRSNP
ncbi:MAG: ABC transporter permease [Chlamydiae bacterium]|nr:ABC transporter permease [Chlamydiota bacterium]